MIRRWLRAWLGLNAVDAETQRLDGAILQALIDMQALRTMVRKEQVDVTALAAQLVAMKPTTTKFERDQKVSEESAVVDPHMGTM